MAYAPLGSNNWILKKNKKMNLMEEIVLKKIAEKYKKTAAQISLNWGLYRGHIIIPKSSKIERVIENFNVYDF
jgi:aldehyde reductase